MTQRDHKFGGAHTEEAVPGSIHSLWSRKEKKLPKMALIVHPDPDPLMSNDK